MALTESTSAIPGKRERAPTVLSVVSDQAQPFYAAIYAEGGVVSGRIKAIHVRKGGVGERRCSKGARFPESDPDVGRLCGKKRVNIV